MKQQYLNDHDVSISDTHGNSWMVYTLFNMFKFENTFCHVKHVVSLTLHLCK